MIAKKITTNTDGNLNIYKPGATTYKEIHNYWNNNKNYKGTDYYSKFLGILKEATKTGIITVPEMQVSQLKTSLSDKYHLLTIIADIKEPSTIYDFK